MNQSRFVFYTYRVVVTLVIVSMVLLSPGAPLSANTDLVNTAATVPDHPGTVSHNPTSMKDIQAADPGANITLIEPPQVTSTGDANLVFPIDLPPGRNQLQPDVKLTYSSGGPNGFLGIGWNLFVPAISIETRWGVPRYSSEYETETYLLNGEQLTPIVHRSDFESRSVGDKEFYTRVEGQFNRIVRHGDGPQTYSWEVTAKDGTRYFYGNEPGVEGVFSLATEGESGNIFRWVLREVRDANGNRIQYSYEYAADPGIVDGGGENGYQLYPSSITYTADTTTPGAYTVTFLRDKEVGPTEAYVRRSDVVIDARGGFKMVTAELLKRIEVSFNADPIRSYDLTYTEGAFGKTLLKSVSQYGENGELFYTHEFNYYGDEIWDQTAGTYQGFSAAQLPWDTGNDTVAGPPADFGFNSPTALSGSNSESVGGSFYGGFNPDAPMKNDSYGGKFGYTHSSSETVLLLIDLNGDNLPDKVFADKNDKVHYRLNLSGPHGGAESLFSAEAIEIESLSSDDLPQETSHLFSGGGEGYPGAAHFLLNQAFTFTTGSVYFADVNADGLPDIVDHGRVLFNFLVDGVPTFDENSVLTPVPIADSSVNPDGLVDEFTEARAEAERVAPVVDTLRRWRAPFAGRVQVVGDVSLLPQTLEDGRPDGVRVAIQHNATELWAEVIPAGDYNPRPPTNVGDIVVAKGDYIYFRVHSFEDGLNDQVAWNPVITYLNTPPRTDVNGLNPYQYQASTDFTVAGRPEVRIDAPWDGTLRLTGPVTKSAVTTDDVTILVIKNEEVIAEQQLAANAVTTAELDLSFDVAAEDKLQLRLKVDSPIDISQLAWTPKLVYIASPEHDVLDENGDPFIELPPLYDIDVYPLNNLEVAQEPWIAPQTGTIYAVPQLSVQLIMPPPPNLPRYGGVLVFTVKHRGELVAKQVMEANDRVVHGAPIQLDVLQGEELFFDLSYHVNYVDWNDDQYLMHTRFQTQGTRVHIYNTAPSEPLPLPDIIAPVSQHWTDQPNLFPQPYRGWAVAGYKGSGDRGALPINQSELRLLCAVEDDDDDCQNDDVPDPDQPNDPGLADTLNGFEGDLANATAYAFYPSLTHDSWKGTDEHMWVRPDAMSSSRNGGYISIPEADDFAGVRAVSRVSHTSQTAIGAGAGPASFSMSGDPLTVIDDGTSLSPLGSSESVVDFLDLNGDGFPDVIGDGSVQFTRPTGVLGATDDPTLPNADNPISTIRETGSFAWSIGVGGNPASFGADSEGRTISSGATASSDAGTANVTGSSSSGGSPGANGNNGGATTSNDTGSQMESVGVSVSGALGAGDSDTTHDLLDINGDGLPDKVRSEGGILRVAFNLGYRFAPEEKWTDSKISDGASENFTVGVSAGYNSGNYGFGGGVSISRNKSTVYETLIDMNGDGLLDRVLPNTDSGVVVAFNTGNSFAAETPWLGALSEVCNKDGLSSFPTGIGSPLNPIDWRTATLCDGVTTHGQGVFFTIGIGPICLGGCYILLNPGLDSSQSIARQDATIRDVNGDGYPDHVASQDNASMQVALNNTGRANLLRSVVRPLGATIHLEYERDGNTYDQPQSRWVLSKVTVDDGHAGDGVDTLVTTYRYEAGYYDRLEREFYGYRKVIEEHRNAADGESVYRSIEREYLNDSFYTKGLPKRQMTRDAAGNPFTETENFYQLRDVTTGLRLTATQPITATVFPELTQTDTRFYEGQPQPGKQTSMIYTYDAFGNVAAYVDTGDVSPEDDLWASLQYSTCEETYIVGIATAIRVESAAGLMRHREADVDCATGNVTQIRQYLLDRQAAVTDLAYYDNGNLLQVTGPANLNGQRYQLTYEYDPVVQTHVTKITDSFGYVSTATYNLKYGAAETTTDINNNPITYVYDAFGRVDSITGPYEQGGVIATLDFEYHHDAETPWAITRHADLFRDPDDTIDTVLFTDGLKRVLQTKKDATIYVGDNAKAQDMMIASGRLTFDFLGRVVEQRYPVTEPLGSPGVLNETVDPIEPTQTTYDVLDRTTRVEIPDDTATTMAYGFGADRNDLIQFQTTVTDANGIRKSVYNDVRQLTVGVEEFNTLADGVVQEIWTSYAYDPLRQIVEVRDNQDNRTSVLYDNLGRRTEIDNPDTGRVTTVYDLASNVIARITPNLRSESEEITYEYDFNRLARINYPDFVGNNVTYTYGEPGAADNRAGRITLVTDQSGAEERFYGQLGELTRQVKTVVRDRQGEDGELPIPQVYTTEFIYDTWGRLQELTYPQGPDEELEVLTYEYDSGGQVRSAIGLVHRGSDRNFNEYVTRLEYDKFEQRVFMKMGNGPRGNGVATHYEYDPLNRRLSTLQAGMPSNDLFQNLGYTYDNVGNVLGVVNDVTLPARTARMPIMTYDAYERERLAPHFGRSEQTFAYDDLYRLTSAEGSYQFTNSVTDRYSLTMTYDTIHNITYKHQRHEIDFPLHTVTEEKTTYEWLYHYDAAQPHAASSIEQNLFGWVEHRTYDYDTNGNQSGYDDLRTGELRRIVWDEENRVQRVVDDHGETRFRYNDAGDRVLKQSDDGYTAYVNQFHTNRNEEQGTNHIFIGATRIAAATMVVAPEDDNEFFYHPNHLGSTQYVTNEQGVIYEHLEYFPFGETWVEEWRNAADRQPYRFTSKELDEETGLYYYGARYYDPRTSVWQSPDMLYASRPEADSHTPADLNLYGYVTNNPLKWLDPSGKYKVLGIHSNANDDAEATEGHAWISVYDSRTRRTETYGLWVDPEMFKNDKKSDVKVGIERERQQRGYSPRFSRYYRLTNEQETRLSRYLEERSEWTPTNTCASWASECVRTVVGEDVDADDWFGLETPREVSQSIKELEAMNPTSPQAPQTNEHNMSSSQKTRASNNNGNAEKSSIREK